jgi:hypothetical protein
MRRWLGRMAFAGAVCLGCASKERPGLARDAPSAPSGSGGSSFVDPDEPTPVIPSPCGSATATLSFVRPNLYFAIDASGSMVEDIPRADAAAQDPDGTLWPRDRYGNLSRAIRTLLSRVGHRVNYGATLFPSTDVSCDAGEELLELTPGDTVSFAVSGEIGPVLRRLMFYIDRRAPGGGTPVALALQGILPKLLDRGAETYLFLVTDGGPNCDLTENCGPDACIPNIERLPLSQEVSCDESVNCCDGSLFGPENCLDADGSVSAVEALAAAGIHTFVIGIPGSEVYAELLNRIAQAGGLPRAGNPSYYRVSDAEELMQTVSALGTEVALGCRIELAETPLDPTLVNLFFDGQLVPADPVDGWNFSDDHTVQVVGEACALMQTGQVLQADVVAGCPVVVR